VISVVIPTAQRPRLLLSALESIANQTYRDLEVIVVNDGGTPLDSVVQPWRQRLSLTLVQLDRRYGPARARNAGVDHASGEYIAFLDDDDIVLPDHLQMAHAAMGSTNADFVYLGVLVTKRRLDSLPSDWESMPVRAYPYDEAFLLVANYIPTGSVLTRNFRDTRVRFDEHLAVCEDWDLWMALTRGLGYRVTFVDHVTSIHHRVPSSPGLVSRAQSSPNQFSLARKRIESKWPSDDQHVNVYRRWFGAFEALRDQRASAGIPTRDLLFGDVLQYLYPRFVHRQPVELEAISQLFEEHHDARKEQWSATAR
jgi:glycosyltransferase involved in cell wall biosynthesis